MAKVTLVDTGPLVALLDARERHHRWAVEALSGLKGPLTTCEAVVTETCFLLARWPEGCEALLERVDSGRLEVVPLAGEHGAVRKLMKKYRDLPMAYADACLVRLSETLADAQVLTLDRDFETYRRRGREVIPLIAPFSNQR